MSRSYKKTPISKDRPKTSHQNKKLASRHVRRQKDFIGKGNSYKKLYCSWDIHDYICYWTLDDVIQAWNEEESDLCSNPWRHKEFKTLDRYINYWKKCMLRK